LELIDYFKLIFRGETIVKIRSESYGDGVVDVSNWCDPNIFLLDFVDKIGDTWPVYKEDLEYIGTEEF
jgi:hypothetical protein